MAHTLQLVDGQQDLPNLIRLGFAFLILDVDPGIANPRRLEDDVTAARLARLPEKLLTDPHEIAEPHISRLASHLLKDFPDRRH
jgi:hypothetical protein